jgi:hypothetical protein
VDPRQARLTAEWTEHGADPALAIAARLRDQGLVVWMGERVVLSERGIPLADFVGREFLELGLAAEGSRTP